MPCWTVRTTTVDIGKMNASILSTALTSLGHAVTRSGDLIIFGGNTYNTKTGALTTQRSQFNEIRQAVVRSYSKHVVLQQARKAGWQAVKVVPRLNA